MKARSKTLLLLAGSVLAAMLVAVFLRSREPACDGRSLSEWLEILVEPDWADLPGVDSRLAIRKIGTNALPYLATFLTYEAPPWKSRFYRVLDQLPDAVVPEWLSVDRSELRAMGSIKAFEILGSMASPAVPRLAVLLNNTTNKELTCRAAFALAGIGRQGLGPLLAVVTNRQSRLRAECLSSMWTMGAEALPALPHIIQCVDDPDTAVARTAVGLIGGLRLAPEQSVPALARSLTNAAPEVRHRAIRSLIRFKAEARPAIPALLVALEDPFLSVRYAATNALRDIDPQGWGTTHSLPVPATQTRGRRPRTRRVGVSRRFRPATA